MDDFEEMGVLWLNRDLHTILRFFHSFWVDLMNRISLFCRCDMVLFIFWLFFGLFIVFIIIVIILLVDQVVANNVESVHDLFHLLIELTGWIIIIIRV
jgi:hypothetical protein